MILSAIRSRRSIREYSSEVPSNDAIEELVMAAQFAPSGKNNRAIEFIIIKDKNTKEKLYTIFAQISPQPFIKEAPVILVLVSDTTKSRWTTQDLSVATENIFLQAASMGLGTVWKNVPSELTQDIKKLLNIPEKYTLINVIPVGYSKDKMPEHDNNDYRKEKIHYERW